MPGRELVASACVVGPVGAGALGAGAGAGRPPGVRGSLRRRPRPGARWDREAGVVSWRNRLSSSRWAVALGPAEDGHQFRPLVGDAEQPPASLPHVRTPGDELFPFFGGGPEDAQVGDALPLRAGTACRRTSGGDRWGHKPSSVWPRERPDGHLSGMAVASHLVRPTRSSDDPGRVSLPIWPCSDWGLPCRVRYRPRGGLLPHHFTLTRKPGGVFSVALSVALRRPGVTWQSALWSSDFPRRAIPAGAPRPSAPPFPGRKLGDARARRKAARLSVPS